MSRPIYEPSLQRTDARLGYTSNQLLRRPAPAAEGAGVISIGYYTADHSIDASGPDDINWTGPDESMSVSADYYGLNAGSNPQIKLPGVYAFHFQVTEQPSFTSGTLARLFISMDVTGGTNGFWTSGTTGDDATGTWAMQIQDDAGAGDYTIDDGEITGYAVWVTGDTFPVTQEWFAQFTEDGVGVTRTGKFRLTFLRLGDADV